MFHFMVLDPQPPLPESRNFYPIASAGFSKTFYPILQIPKCCIHRLLADCLSCPLLFIVSHFVYKQMKLVYFLRFLPKNLLFLARNKRKHSTMKRCCQTNKMKKKKKKYFSLHDTLATSITWENCLVTSTPNAVF